MIAQAFAIKPIRQEVTLHEKMRGRKREDAEKEVQRVKWSFLKMLNLIE